MGTTSFRPPSKPRYGTYTDEDTDHGEIVVRVTAADFNGQEWDGRPFSATPDWLVKAIKDARIVPHTTGSTDYAQWHVTTGSGQIVNATPGDLIIRRSNGDLSVIEEQDAYILFNLRAPDISQQSSEAVTK